MNLVDTAPCRRRSWTPPPPRAVRAEPAAAADPERDDGARAAAAATADLALLHRLGASGLRHDRLGAGGLRHARGIVAGRDREATTRPATSSLEQQGHPPRSRRSCSGSAAAVGSARTARGGGGVQLRRRHGAVSTKFIAIVTEAIGTQAAGSEAIVTACWRANGGGVTWKKTTKRWDAAGV
jgi:hypothetical protein